MGTRLLSGLAKEFYAFNRNGFLEKVNMSHLKFQVAHVLTENNRQL